MRKYIGIDVGRKLTKVATEHGVKVFPSVVGEYREMKIGSTRDYVTSIDGQRYFVGDMADESYYRREMSTESKIHEETKTLFLTALATTGVGIFDEFTVATGLPVTQHDEETKAKLNALLRGNFQVSLNGGPEKMIRVERLAIVPEGAATFYNELLDDEGKIRRQELLRYGSLLVIDVGSRTVNYVELVGGRYRDRNSGTLPYGAKELDLRDSVEARHAFARRIVGDLSERLPDLSHVEKFLLTGGGTKKIGCYLQQMLNNAEVVSDPITANVCGFRKLGMQFDKQQAIRQSV